MDNNFTRALTFTLKWEGGYSNDPNDPGGETKWGISKRAHPELDIKNLTEGEAAKIYHTNYWTPLKCDKFDLPMAVCVFDTAVNCGVHRTTKLLEGCTTFKELLAHRIDYYARLITTKPVLRKYYKGWINRVVDLRKYAEIIELEKRIP